MATATEFAQAKQLGKMEEAIEASVRDRRDIWSTLNDLRKIAGQNETIMAKLDELATSFREHQDKTDARIQVLTDKTDDRIRALEAGHYQAGGAMKVVIGFAAVIGAVVSSMITFAITHAFSGSK